MQYRLRSDYYFYLARVKLIAATVGVIARLASGAKLIVAVSNLSDAKTDEPATYSGPEPWMRFSVSSSTTAYTPRNFRGATSVDP